MRDAKICQAKIAAWNCRGRISTAIKEGISALFSFLVAAALRDCLRRRLFSLRCVLVRLKSRGMPQQHLEFLLFSAGPGRGSVFRGLAIHLNPLFRKY
jgi:hypothetical protein